MTTLFLTCTFAFSVPNSPLKTLLHANSRRSSLVSVKDQRNSHLLVLDYAQDILQHFRNTEVKSKALKDV